MIQLSDHFNYKMLLRFALAPIGSMIFTSLYGIVDGYFVSNYAGSTPFASLNLVYPFIMLVEGVGFMFGSGGSALVAYHLGRGEREKACSYFSLITYTTIVTGLILGTMGYIFAPWVSKVLGASEAMLPYCVLYLRVMMVGVPFFMLQNLFQVFLITAEHPQLGFRITLIAVCSNIILDFILVGVFKWGLGGAAWASVINEILGAVIPLVLFFQHRDWVIHLGKTRWEWMSLIKTCSNGISEFLNNISMSLVGFLYNYQLMKFYGQDGVAAFGIIMYVSFIFIAIYIGFTMGVSPIISYHYGAENKEELKNLYRKSIHIMLFTNLAMFFSAELLGRALASLFVGYDEGLCNLTVKGLRIYATAYLAMGINVFSSAFFTALGNGKISAKLSVSRTLGFDTLMLLLLPALLGPEGIWLVALSAEILALVMSIAYLLKNGARYGYLESKQIAGV